MFYLLFIMISYGAFLLLMMPATAVGIISTAAAFILGASLFAYKKVQKIAFWKNKHYFLIPVVILVAVTLGIRFYNLWITSSKMHALAGMLHIPTEIFLFVGSLILSVLSVYFLYAALQTIVNKFSDTDPKNDFSKSLLSGTLASVITVILAQVMLGTEVLSMGYLNFACGVLTVLVAVLLLYCLIGRIVPSVIVGTGLFMVISTVNAYVYSFRGRLFEPIDIVSAGTAMNVAENYSLFPIPYRILIGWGVFAAVPIVLYCLHRRSASKPAANKRYVLLAICVVCTVALSLYAANLKTYHWKDEGARFNGYILDFVSKFKEISVSKPDNYGTELIDEFSKQYAQEKNKDPENEKSKPAHIIVIMDEAFSDLGVFGELSTNKEVMPFISSLKENTVSGNALVSVYGGNTANSEYEFLTGNSMAWLSPNVVPYQQYIRSSTYSMVSYLKSTYNYECLAMHPYLSSGWNRPAAYEHLGFDECYFIEDFPREDYIREYVSDREMFEFLIETYEAKKEEPLFLFGVTMQNHGDYTYIGENYEQHISLNDHTGEYPEVEQYLSLIHETDKAVEYLISYFQNADEDVVVVFFGDHQPKMQESFYESIGKTTADTLDGQQKRYEVPFFIWTNYDIEEKYISRTGLNYLSSYVYDAAGIKLPPYNGFLREMEERIPAINANGFYSPSAESYLPFDEARGDERRWLDLYEILQYNSIFDKKHRSEIFFPALK